MTPRQIAYLLGPMLLGLAALMSVPAFVAWYLDGPGRTEFFTSAGMVALLGALLFAYGRTAEFRVSARAAFLITASAWLSAALLGALPMVLISHIDYADAFFETMSGITTTGSTVLVGLEDMADSLLLWRSLLQWAGGLGFTLTAVAILPLLGVGGMRLFRTESSDWSEKSAPRARVIALRIATVYVAISIACAACYAVAGMSVFDAVNHSMTTVSTGGFSTSDRSIGYFESPSIEWIAVVFMLAASLPFSLYVRAIENGSAAPLVRDEQVRGFLLTTIVAIVFLGLWHGWTADVSFADALRQSAFSATAVITTTGYASVDYSTWGTGPVMIFFVLMFVGGCSGSTAGSMKMFRIQVAFHVLRCQIRRQVHPYGVFRVIFNGAEVPTDVVASILGFATAFFATIAVGALALSMFGLDFVTSLSGSATAVTNVGPGFGSIVGPSGNFASIPEGAKCILALSMLIGRLEIMTMVVLLSRSFWRG